MGGDNSESTRVFATSLKDAPQKYEKLAWEHICSFVVEIPLVLFSFPFACGSALVQFPFPGKRRWWIPINCRVGQIQGSPDGYWVFFPWNNVAGEPLLVPILASKGWVWFGRRGCGKLGISIWKAVRNLECSFPSMFHSFSCSTASRNFHLKKKAVEVNVLLEAFWRSVPLRWMCFRAIRRGKHRKKASPRDWSLWDIRCRHAGGEARTGPFLKCYLVDFLAWSKWSGAFHFLQLQQNG